MKNQDERKFTDAVDTIDAAERDVDRVLDAARLERHEGPDMRMTGEQRYNIIMALIGAVSVLVFFLSLTLGPIALG